MTTNAKNSVDVLVETLERIAVDPRSGCECEWCGEHIFGRGDGSHNAACPTGQAQAALAAFRVLDSEEMHTDGIGMGLT